MTLISVSRDQVRYHAGKFAKLIARPPRTDIPRWGGEGLGGKYFSARQLASC